jgi:3-phenylpropionate/trans-cinnamate dioxygenase ferredoxin subunit
MALERIAAAGEVPEGEARRYEVGGHEVCLVNLGDAGYRAIGDLCTHAQSLLNEGEIDVEDETVECPRHGSTFDLNTGAAKTLPATLAEPVYTVKVEDDEILIEVPNGGNDD